MTTFQERIDACLNANLECLYCGEPISPPPGYIQCEGAWCTVECMRQWDAEIRRWLLGDNTGGHMTDTPDISPERRPDILESEVERLTASALIHRTVAGTATELPIHFSQYIAALEAENARLRAALSAATRDSESLREIAAVMGLTLIHEDTVVRPASMSYVKPSELPAIIENCL